MKTMKNSRFYKDLLIDAIYANLQEIIRKANELIRSIDDHAESGDGKE